MAVDKIVDISLINESLQKVAKGAGIVFIGTVIGTILGFAERAIIARYYTQAQYGVFSLALILFNIFAIIATLGLQEGAARQIAYYRGKGDDKKVRGIIISSIEIALIASIILSSILFFSSNFISTKIFHEEKLISTLKIISMALPFFVLINIFTAIMRGFRDAKAKVYFQDISKNIIFIILLTVVIWLNLSFLWIIYGLVLSIIISSAMFFIFITKKIFFIQKKKSYVSVKKELLFFSLPLLVGAVLTSIISWTDTIMLGYFKTATIVGIYNTALPLSRLLPIILVSTGFLYVPIISELYAKKLLNEIEKIYQILTKWIFLFTFPIFFIFFLFPGAVLKFIFGADYIPASTALMILSAGFLFHVFLGPNALTLIVSGKTKFLMFTSSVAAISNIVLNVILIPIFSIEGAAIASLSSYCITNILNSTKLYKLYNIHPFTRNYLKSISVGVILLSLIYFFTLHLKVELWMIPIFLIVFLFSYFVLLLVVKSFDKADMAMFLAMEKKIGIDLKIVKKVLRRFI